MYSAYTHWTDTEAVRVNATGSLTPDQAARIERALAVGKVVWWPFIVMMLLSSSSVFYGQVAHLDGRVYVRYAGGPRTSRVYYSLNSREFELTQAQVMRMAYLVIVEGRRYRVYFTPGDKRVVSLEPID